MPVLGCICAQEPKELGKGDWPDGCGRRMELRYQQGTDVNRDKAGFLKFSGIKLPDTRSSHFFRGVGLEECGMRCLSNCSCNAYSALDVSGAGNGCLLWFGRLVDMRVFKQNGLDIYVKVDSTEIGMNRKKKVGIVVGSTLLSGMLFLGLCLTAYFRRRNQLRKQGKQDLEVPSFDYAVISWATNHFSADRKLGEGGFGPVYKGKMERGQEIAVKVLSRNSRQGFDEFENEVLFIAKLQHRNLVKLLGCCVQREKMLIYEYMPNKSLDYFIFDTDRSTSLNWPKQFDIINGISRGILYLHQDSRLRIIHRDLKASNILLDWEMNQKISDFGLARSFGGNETEASTARVVGTHGYMSPEYAVDGHFSMKSDVFSFGVLALEIVSGKRNLGFYHPEHNHNLLGHAWKLYNENRTYEFMDPSLVDSCNFHKVFRTIHVALLCVQQLPEDRPGMPSVVLMLSSEISLPQPKQPGFFMERKTVDTHQSSSKEVSWSANELSMTFLEAR